MSANVVLGFFVLPGIAFGLAYFPVIRTLSRSLLVAYPKADLRSRALAGGVDTLLVIATGWPYLTTGSVGYLITGAAYVLLRDAVAGRSVGKFLFGLLVINLETGEPSKVADSLRRNMVFLLPGANVVALFLEPITIARDPQGQRLGDRIAMTQVVDGFGIKDLAESFVRWWSINSPFEPEGARRPARLPVEVDRTGRSR